MLSTMVHALFGYALCGASLARMVEICFVLKEQRNAAEAVEVGATPSPTPTSGGQSPTTGQRAAAQSPRVFSYLPAYLMVAAGILFMSATDEELHWADDQGVDGGTWGLIDFSWAFFVFFYTSVLVDKYTSWGGRYGQRNAAARAAAEQDTEGSSAAYRPVAPTDPDHEHLEMADRSLSESAPLAGEEDAVPLSKNSSPPSSEGNAELPQEPRVRFNEPASSTRQEHVPSLARESIERPRPSIGSDPHHVLWSTHDDPGHDPFADSDDTATLA